MKRVFLLFFKFYKKYLSFILLRLFGRGCKHYPTCSEYAYDAVNKYGSISGTLLSLKRFVRCNWFNRGDYYDPVQ